MTTTSEIVRHRLANQRLAGARSDRPEDVVSRMGVIQAQDYLGALWAVGLRLPGVIETDVEQALAQRRIVRTWPVRGTLHFVAAADVWWMLELLAPPAIARGAGRFRQLGLDETTFARSRKIVARVLQGGRQLTRAALYQKLEAARIPTAGQRGIHILWRLALEGLICFGDRQGKQQTFALLPDRVPPANTLARDRALAELARRYFTSHGPATLQDFVWWSGLTMSGARAGLEMAARHLGQATIGGQIYWQPHPAPGAGKGSSAAHLLPAFDEYLVGYRDRSAMLDPRQVKRVNAGGGILAPTIVIGGQVMGTWSRRLANQAVVITPRWFTAPTKAQQRAFGRAAQSYGAFLGLPVVFAETPV